MDPTTSGGYGVLYGPHIDTERYLSEVALRKRVAKLEAQLKTPPVPAIA